MIIDPDFKCFRVPDRNVDPSEEMVNWLSEHNGWDGDSEGIVIYEMANGETDHEVCFPGDWITSIDTISGRKLVRLPRKGRKMRMCQMPDDSEKELWVWELPNGQAVYLYDGREPRLTTLSVDKDSNRGIWIPGKDT